MTQEQVVKALRKNSKIRFRPIDTFEANGNLLDINDDSIRIRTERTPASATATGIKGQIVWDADYVYVCTATNVWKRTALATW